MGKKLNKEALTENRMRPSSSLSSTQRVFLLDVKVTWVSSEHGRTKKERWRRKVLNMLECQLETRPMKEPKQEDSQARHVQGAFFYWSALKMT